jgi:hypothetical protein
MQSHPANILTYYPALEQCLQETDENFGLVILDILKAYMKDNKQTQIKQSLCKEAIINQWQMPPRTDHPILKAKFEEKVEDAWRWLHDEKLIKPEPGWNGQHGVVVVTELGLATTRNQRELLEETKALPENLVHSRIMERIRTDFRAGYYDKAVQDAFKQVEDETRNAANLEQRVSGEDVFKRAFAKGSPLYPHCLKPNDEVQFYCVSYRIHRHPASHGNVILEPKSAARMVVLASHLLYRLDEIRARAAPS